MSCAEVVIGEAISEREIELQVENYRILSVAPEISKYGDAVIEEFQEEYTRFPPDANPLDPRFMDPRILAADQGGHARFRHQGGQGGRENRELQQQLQALQAGAGIDVNDLDGLLAQFQAMGIDLPLEEIIAQFQLQNEGGMAGGLVDPNLPPGNLDPNLPLLQLFLQTLLPWNRLNVPNRPPHEEDDR